MIRTSPSTCITLRKFVFVRKAWATLTLESEFLLWFHPKLFKISNFCSGQERWIRLEIGKGDFLIIPAGVYHRYILKSVSELSKWELIAFANDLILTRWQIQTIGWNILISCFFAIQLSTHDGYVTTLLTQILNLHCHSQEFIKGSRLYASKPDGVFHFRSDNLEVRKEYLKKLAKGFKIQANW
jgi:hypothetical protein